MRSLLLVLPLAGLATGAFAADLPRSAPPPPVPAPLFSWTGPYSGLFVGYADLDNKTNPVCTGILGTGANGLLCPIRSPQSPRADGFIAGSELGYNLQLSPGSGFVVGGAIDYQFTTIRSYGEQFGAFPVVGIGPIGGSVYHVGQRIDGMGTARGKLGYAFDRFMIYATGGLAVAQVRIDTNTTLLGVPAFDNRGGDRRYGYVVGGGIEYAISPHLSVKGEALYYDFGSKTLASPSFVPGFFFPASPTVGARVETSGVLGRVGLNYRFDDGGIPVIGPITDVIGALANPVPYTPLVSQVWDFEVGGRYFYSSGSFRKSLDSPTTPGQLNSRLTYRDFPAHSGETFARIDHNPSGLFAKGFFGSGFVTSGGKLNDEDFPPAIPAYSNTVSKIRHGDIALAAVDVGYTFLKGDTYKLGGFAGYQYFAERATGYGCAQTATFPICVPTIPTNIAVLTQDAHWNAFRVGLTGEVRYDRYKLQLEGAYLPVASMTAYDRHWLRQDINPLLETGSGDGYFLQGVVSYDLTQNISLGIGGRYLKMSTGIRDGSTRFPFATAASPEKFSTDRAGVFVQLSYRFTDPDFGLGALVRKY